MLSSRSPRSHSLCLGRRNMTLFLEGPLLKGVPSAVPSRSYWRCFTFDVITPGAGGTDTGSQGHRALEDTGKNLFLLQLQGTSLWVVGELLMDTTQWECLCGTPHCPVAYLKCRKNDYTKLQTVNTEAADLWGSWTKGGYPRPSRVSSVRPYNQLWMTRTFWITSGSEAFYLWCLVGHIPNSSSKQLTSQIVRRSWPWSRLLSDKQLNLVVVPSERAQEISPETVPLSTLDITYFWKTSYCTALLFCVVGTFHSVSAIRAPLSHPRPCCSLCPPGRACVCVHFPLSSPSKNGFQVCLHVDISLQTFLSLLYISFSFWLFESLFVTIWRL